jgi:hypothetical protein
MIEDSDEDAELVIRKLCRARYDVSFERVDMPEGMSATLENRAWDVVICDFRICSADALGLQRGRNLDMPFIYVSGMIGAGLLVDILIVEVPRFVGRTIDGLPVISLQTRPRARAMLPLLFDDEKGVC